MMTMMISVVRMNAICVDVTKVRVMTDEVNDPVAAKNEAARCPIYRICKRASASLLTFSILIGRSMQSVGAVDLCCDSVFNHDDSRQYSSLTRC